MQGKLGMIRRFKKHEKKFPAFKMLFLIAAVIFLIASSLFLARSRSNLKRLKKSFNDANNAISMKYPNPQFDVLQDTKTGYTFPGTFIVKKTIFKKVITDKNRINSCKFEVVNVEIIHSSKFTHNGCEYKLMDFEFKPCYLSENYILDERFELEKDEIIHDKTTDQYFRYESYTPKAIYSVSAMVGNICKTLYLGDQKKDFSDLKREMIRKEKIRLLIMRFVELIAICSVFYAQFNPSLEIFYIPVSITSCFLLHELTMVL